MHLFSTSHWSHALISAFSGDVVDPIHFPPPSPARSLPPAAHRSAAAAPSLALRPPTTSPSSPHSSAPVTDMTAHHTPAVQPLLTQQVIAQTALIISRHYRNSRLPPPLFTPVPGAGRRRIPPNPVGQHSGGIHHLAATNLNPSPTLPVHSACSQ